MQLRPDMERLNWIQSRLRIKTKSGTICNLYPNRQQRRLHLLMEAQRMRGLPVRLLMLKHRQWGGSTWSEAEAFYDVFHSPNRTAMSVSVDTDSTEHLFGMITLFESGLGQNIRKPTDATNRKEIAWSAPHRSTFLAHTAGKMSLGRSFTVQHLLASEVAFWHDAANQMAGLHEAIPMTPGTTVVQETTGNGQGGFFYDEFREAIAKRQRHPDDYSGYLPVFMAWKDHEEYAIEPPVGIVWTAEELEVKRVHRLTDAQLYWRRKKIEEKNGDLALFHQEYPLTWQEAFIASGSPVFAHDIISLQSAHLGTRFQRGYFEQTGGQIRFVEDRHGSWIVAEPPRGRTDYSIGVDTAEAKLSSPRNPRSDLDYDGVCVFNRNSGRVAAIYHGRADDQRELGDQVYLAGLWYNEAWMAPEIPQGMVLLSRLKDRDYPNLYNRQVHEDHATEMESESLGWRTTEVSRRWLVDDFVAACRSGEVKVVFPEILGEMQTFVRDERGRPGHMPGEHDDLLFSAMIAYQVAKRCPKNSEPYPADHVGDDLSHRDSWTLNDLARIGAVDTGDDEDEDPDSWQEYVD